MRKILTFLVILGMAFCCCEGKKQAEAKNDGGSSMEIKVTSSAFEEGGMIPSKYTCDGEDISPPLHWEGLPEGTKSIALISDDPDAPRWFVYDPRSRGARVHRPHDGCGSLPFGPGRIPSRLAHGRPAGGGEPAGLRQRDRPAW